MCIDLNSCGHQCCSPSSLQVKVCSALNLLFQENVTECIFQQFPFLLFNTALGVILIISERRSTKNWNKMASVLQNVKATMAWRKHQLLADFDENESPVPDKFKRRASFTSLNSICMSLRKRVPLKQVQLNFPKTPTWKSLKARQKCQSLKSIKRTAINTFGTVSQGTLPSQWGVDNSLGFASTSVLRFLDSVQNAVFQRLSHTLAHCSYS